MIRVTIEIEDFSVTGEGEVRVVRESSEDSPDALKRVLWLAELQAKGAMSWTGLA